VTYFESNGPRYFPGSDVPVVGEVGPPCSGLAAPVAAAPVPSAAPSPAQRRWVNGLSDVPLRIAGRFNTRGTSDSKNDIMLYSVVQAESHEAAAKSFEGHPHLQIPQASIEVMEIHSLQGMA
jgi:hypothetical protein